MCNCGNNRQTLTQQETKRMNSESFSAPSKKTWADVHFVYTGKTALTVSGNATGKLYRFAKPGEEQAIDFRDAAAMMQVPVLRRVK